MNNSIVINSSANQPAQTKWLISPFFHFNMSPPFPQARSKTEIGALRPTCCLNLVKISAETKQHLMH